MRPSAKLRIESTGKPELRVASRWPSILLDDRGYLEEWPPVIQNNYKEPVGQRIPRTQILDVGKTSLPTRRIAALSSGAKYQIRCSTVNIFGGQQLLTYRQTSVPQ